MKLKYLYITILSTCLLSMAAICQVHQGVNTYKLITKQNLYTAGDVINLRFSYNGNSEISLYCSNAYGAVVLSPSITKAELNFVIPQAISKKSGVLSWQLISDKTEIIGQIHIKPKLNAKTIESYLGPPSIEAGGTDYAMLVVIPTDHLDNALSDSTKVTIKHQFMSNRYASDVFTKHGFGYINIYSEKKEGRILLSSESTALNSKEYDINVVPAIPTNFKINAKRIHDYADGNQITTLVTSVIKDRFGNTVSDGTFVTFHVTNQEGYKSKTYGTTINGMATANLLQPDHEEQWLVKAYIEGMANSNSITLNYKQAIEDFKIIFSENKRHVTVGPIKSFMNQRIPDGLNVQLLIYKNDVLQYNTLKQTRNGMTEFNLNSDRFTKGTYKLVFTAAGITKTFTKVIYE